MTPAARALRASADALRAQAESLDAAAAAIESAAELDAWVALPAREIVEPYGVRGRVLLDGLRRAGLAVQPGRPPRARRADVDEMLAARAVVRPLRSAAPAGDTEDEYLRAVRATA